MMWGLGTVIGPFLGGMLSNPSKSLPGLFKDTLFETHPYFLPTLVAGFVCLVGLVGLLLFLPETNPNQVEIKQVKSDIELQAICSNESTITDNEKQSVVGEKEGDNTTPQGGGGEGVKDPNHELGERIPPSRTIKNRLLDAMAWISRKLRLPVRFSVRFSRVTEEEPSINSKNESNNNNTTPKSTSSETTTPTITTTIEPSRWEVTKTLLLDITVQKAVVLYMILSIVYLTLDEIFPLWAAFPEPLGLGFREIHLGIIWLVSGLSLLIFNLMIYAPLSRRFGTVKIFRIGTLLAVVSIAVLPFTALTTAFGPVVKWGTLGFVMLWRTWSGAICFTSANILVNVSAPVEHAGKVNGLANSCAGLVRAICPAVGGIVFAWSSKINVFPIDVRFTFLALSVLSIVNFYIGGLFPPGIGESLTRLRS
jgi:hypothetical protein